MGLVEGLLLFLAAVAAGGLNSVAGGGSFITFPALLFFGVPPIPANATNTVALWPGSLASVGAYRREMVQEKGRLVPLSIISLIGGFAGAWLLLETPEATFESLIPWLLLLATLVFAFGGMVVNRIREYRGHHTVGTGPRLNVTGIITQLVIATYGGFFGGGIGILMLAALAISGMENIHAMNGLKNWLAACINGVAVVTFLVAGVISWPHAIVMVAGSIAGGYGGASLARKIDPRYVRLFVIAVGSAMTVYFFVKG